MFLRLGHVVKTGLISPVQARTSGMMGIGSSLIAPLRMLHTMGSRAWGAIT